MVLRSPRGRGQRQAEDEMEDDIDADRNRDAGERPSSGFAPSRQDRKAEATAVDDEAGFRQRQRIGDHHRDGGGDLEQPACGGQSGAGRA
jgi:hypothetical protein